MWIDRVFSSKSSNSSKGLAFDSAALGRDLHLSVVGGGGGVGSLFCGICASARCRTVGHPAWMESEAKAGAAVHFSDRFHMEKNGQQDFLQSQS